MTDSTGLSRQLILPFMALFRFSAPAFAPLAIFCEKNMKWRSERLRAVLRRHGLASIIVAAAAVAVYGFVVAHGNVLLNRCTDATWHMAVADEFALTGRFAADPFFPGAPRFAQFSLLDATNGTIQRITGFPKERVLIHATAFAAACFVVAAYMAGLLASGSRACGLFTMFTVSAAALTRDMTLMRLGWPFNLASALLILLCVVASRLFVREPGCCAQSSEADRRPVVTRIRWLALGCFAGVIFDIHPFPGLFAVAVVAANFLVLLSRRGWRALRRDVASLVLVCAGFLAIAWPWLFLHITLRGSLAVANAHVFQYPTPRPTALQVAALLVALCLVASGIRGRTVRCPRSHRAQVQLIGLGVCLLCFALPPVNAVLASRTSTYMAQRVLWLMPTGLLLGLLPWSAASVAGPRRIHAGMQAALIVTIVVSLCPDLWQGLKTHVYLVRTNDYDTHPYACLEKLGACGLAGRVVLSDPFTSYFARRFLGAYAVTVPSGHAAPAIDYVERDAVYRRLLHDPGALHGWPGVEFVLLNRRSREGFVHAGVDDAVVDAFSLSDRYVLVFEDSDFALFKVQSGK